MSDSDDSEKTEEPTPEKRRKAREEGQFPRAKDSGPTVATFAALGTISFTGTLMGERLVTFAQRSFAEPFELVNGDVAIVGERLMMTIGAIVMPVLLAAMIGGTAMGFAEAGLNPRFELLAPKWERLDPLSKLTQMLSPKAALVNIVLQVGRVGALAVVVYTTVVDALPLLIRTSRAALEGAVLQVGDSVMALAVRGSLALAILAALDYGQSWFKHENQLKMSRQELKEEHHQAEGDPKVRARQRQRAREMAKHGMVQAVKEADVILANPTHVSVAIRYRAEEGAPIVAAKGYDDIALYIRELAKEHNVPIITNVPLARALAAKVKVGRHIPTEMYAAVAEVLALVYRMKVQAGRRVRG